MLAESFIALYPFPLFSKQKIPQRESSSFRYLDRASCINHLEVKHLPWKPLKKKKSSLLRLDHELKFPKSI